MIASNPLTVAVSSPGSVKASKPKSVDVSKDSVIVVRNLSTPASGVGVGSGIVRVDHANGTLSCRRPGQPPQGFGRSGFGEASPRGLTGGSTRGSDEAWGASLPRTDVGSDERPGDAPHAAAHRRGSDEAWGRLTPPRTDVGSDEAWDASLPRTDVGSDEAWDAPTPPRTDVGSDEAWTPHAAAHRRGDQTRPGDAFTATHRRGSDECLLSLPRTDVGSDEAWGRSRRHAPTWDQTRPGDAHATHRRRVRRGL